MCGASSSSSLRWRRASARPTPASCWATSLDGEHVEVALAVAGHDLAGRRDEQGLDVGRRHLFEPGHAVGDAGRGARQRRPAAPSRAARRATAAPRSTARPARARACASTAGAMASSTSPMPSCLTRRSSRARVGWPERGETRSRDDRPTSARSLRSSLASMPAIAAATSSRMWRPSGGRTWVTSVGRSSAPCCGIERPGPARAQPRQAPLVELPGQRAQLAHDHGLVDAALAGRAICSSSERPAAGSAIDSSGWAVGLIIAEDRARRLLVRAHALEGARELEAALVQRGVERDGALQVGDRRRACG